MTRHIAALAVLALTLAANESPAQDWWSQVPALPKACYSQQDKFLEEIEKLSNALGEVRDLRQATDRPARDTLSRGRQSE